MLPAASWAYATRRLAGTPGTTRKVPAFGRRKLILVRPASTVTRAGSLSDTRSGRRLTSVSRGRTRSTRIGTACVTVPTASVTASATL